MTAARLKNSLAMSEVNEESSFKTLERGRELLFDVQESLEWFLVSEVGEMRRRPP